ncbi:MAG TPA: VWA domain-containing protein [Terriglobia bacterium]|jgi:Ca-activated chloride channel family protein|nr:VWA domain-containing protein [Terriglobia bacterium]
MKYVKYGRYVPDALDGLSSEDLMKLLENYLLDSGFYNQFYDFREMDGEQTLESLRQALLEAMRESEAVPESVLQELMNRAAEGDEASELERALNRLIQRMADEGYISIDAPPEAGRLTEPQSGSGAGGDGRVKFEVTDKALDFLGFKALKDLLGSLGKSSFGRHDTRELATGVEASGSTRRYEFGDTLNLDVNATLLAAIGRQGLKMPLDLDYPDLQVRQAEYQSSCATVLMLDCSHSMILYGEDRFTPAKRVALALSHLIRSQYPGDSLHMVLFHDSAEEIPVGQLARVKVGPYYTNTREGLKLAQRVLSRQKKDMRQIVMITDGKPSALTLEDGRIYKNAFGLDPLVVSETLREVGRCRRNGILINTFMLASDWGLVDFVQKVTQICRGKAYFTTPYTLGQYLLMDYMEKKVRKVH